MNNTKPVSAKSVVIRVSRSEAQQLRQKFAVRRQEDQKKEEIRKEIADIKADLKEKFIGEGEVLRREMIDDSLSKGARRGARSPQESCFDKTLIVRRLVVAPNLGGRCFLAYLLQSKAPKVRKAYASFACFGMIFANKISYILRCLMVLSSSNYISKVDVSKKLIGNNAGSYLYLPRITMALSLFPAVRKTFSFNTNNKEIARLSDLIENHKILESRYPQANMVLNGRLITCPCCLGNCCEGCSYEGQIWEEGIGLSLRGLRSLFYAASLLWYAFCKWGEKFLPLFFC